MELLMDAVYETIGRKENDERIGKAKILEQCNSLEFDDYCTGKSFREVVKQSRLYNDVPTVYGLQRKNGKMYKDNLSKDDLRNICGIKMNQSVDAWLTYHNEWNGYHITERNKYEVREFGRRLKNEQYRFFVREDGVCYKIDKETRTKYYVDFLDDGDHIYPRISKNIKICKKYPMESVMLDAFYKNMNMKEVFLVNSRSKFELDNLLILSEENYNKLLYMKDYLSKTRTYVQFDINGEYAFTLSNYSKVKKMLKLHIKNIERKMKIDGQDWTKANIEIDYKFVKEI